MNQAERKFALSIFVQGGHGPFRGLDAPFSAEKSVTTSPDEVNQRRGAAGHDQSEGLSFFLQDHVHRMLGGNVLRACIAERRQVDAGK
jgi:hypothetical protein